MDGENHQNDDSRPRCARRDRTTVSDFYRLKNPARSFNCPWCQIHGILFWTVPAALADSWPDIGRLSCCWFQLSLFLKGVGGWSGISPWTCQAWVTLSHSSNDHRDTQTLPRRQRADTVGRDHEKAIWFSNWRTRLWWKFKFFVCLMQFNKWPEIYLIYSISKIT